MVVLLLFLAHSKVHAGGGSETRTGGVLQRLEGLFQNGTVNVPPYCSDSSGV